MSSRDLNVKLRLKCRVETLMLSCDLSVERRLEFECLVET